VTALTRPRVARMLRRGMTFAHAIDLYIADLRSEGRINSESTERAYRECLGVHCDDVANRDPSKVGREDIRRTLRHWDNPNTQRQKHAILTSFYRWAMEEGYRDTNPAQMVRRSRSRPVNVYRPTLPEIVALLDASMAVRRERWVTHLGLMAGLRRQELCGLQGRHLARTGWVWVSPDIGKGGKGRWMPVLEELEPVVAEILALVGPTDYVIPSLRSTRPADGQHHQAEQPDKPISGSGMHRLVRRVGRRAGLAVEIGPHTLRHGYGDHIARYAGLKAAQALMGHASVETTESSYTSGVTLDELAVSLHGFSYRRLSAQTPTSTPQRDSNAR
jgi:integrase/recombinase XerD